MSGVRRRRGIQLRRPSGRRIGRGSFLDAFRSVGARSKDRVPDGPLIGNAEIQDHMALYGQTGRLISVTTPLGEDKLLLTGFTGHEAISRLFQFHLTTLSEDTAIDFTQIVGQSVTINVTQSDDSLRYFNGIVSHFACTGKDGDMTRYELQVVPKLWTLTRYADCRIFHNKEAPDIIKQVLDDRGISTNASLTGEYKKLEYCVQYRETDFNFISRLMEQFGIFYFFEHEDGDHTMMLGDSTSVHQDCPGQSNAGFNLARRRPGRGRRGECVEHRPGIAQRQALPDRLQLHHFHDRPAASETTIYTVASNDQHGDIRLSRSCTSPPPMARRWPSCACRRKRPCTRFGRGSQCVPGVHLRLQIRSPGPSAGGDEHVLPAHRDSPRCLGCRDVSRRRRRAERHLLESLHLHSRPTFPFRPARHHAKPFVQGPQTAMVVGKSADQDSADDQSAGGDGEEIWVDKWGRVLVLFPWDRKKATSCWVRVSQDWAGKGWGMINIPRVGQEVIVSFLEGDPDRPIITGRVYNDVQTVPYTLPDNGTRTTFRTSSSTGGGTAHYNELRFEDKTGNGAGLRSRREGLRHPHPERLARVDRKQPEHHRQEGPDGEGGGDESIQITENAWKKWDNDDNLDVDRNLNQKAGQNISIQAGRTCTRSPAVTSLTRPGRRST